MAPSSSSRKQLLEEGDNLRLQQEWVAAENCYLDVLAKARSTQTKASAYTRLAALFIDASRNGFFTERLERSLEQLPVAAAPSCNTQQKSGVSRARLLPYYTRKRMSPVAVSDSSTCGLNSTSAGSSSRRRTSSSVSAESGKRRNSGSNSSRSGTSGSNSSGSNSSGGEASDSNGSGSKSRETSSSNSRSSCGSSTSGNTSSCSGGSDSRRSTDESISEQCGSSHSSSTCSTQNTTTYRNSTCASNSNGCSNNSKSQSETSFFTRCSSSSSSTRTSSIGGSSDSKSKSSNPSCPPEVAVLGRAEAVLLREARKSAAAALRLIPHSFSALYTAATAAALSYRWHDAAVLSAAAARRLKGLPFYCLRRRRYAVSRFHPAGAAFVASKASAVTARTAQAAALRQILVAAPRARTAAAAAAATMAAATTTSATMATAAAAAASTASAYTTGAAVAAARADATAPANTSAASMEAADMRTAASPTAAQATTAPAATMAVANTSKLQTIVTTKAAIAAAAAATWTTTSLTTGEAEASEYLNTSRHVSAAALEGITPRSCNTDGHSGSCSMETIGSNSSWRSIISTLGVHKSTSEQFSDARTDREEKPKGVYDSSSRNPSRRSNARRKVKPSWLEQRVLSLSRRRSSHPLAADTVNIALAALLSSPPRASGIAAVFSQRRQQLLAHLFTALLPAADNTRSMQQQELAKKEIASFLRKTFHHETQLKNYIYIPKPCGSYCLPLLSPAAAEATQIDWSDPPTGAIPLASSASPFTVTGDTGLPSPEGLYGCNINDLEGRVERGFVERGQEEQQGELGNEKGCSKTGALSRQSLRRHAVLRLLKQSRGLLHVYCELQLLQMKASLYLRQLLKCIFIWKEHNETLAALMPVSRHRTCEGRSSSSRDTSGSSGSSGSSRKGNNSRSDTVTGGNREGPGSLWGVKEVPQCRCETVESSWGSKKEIPWDLEQFQMHADLIGGAAGCEMLQLFHQEYLHTHENTQLLSSSSPYCQHFPSPLSSFPAVSPLSSSISFHPSPCFSGAAAVASPGGSPPADAHVSSPHIYRTSIKSSTATSSSPFGDDAAAAAASAFFTSCATSAGKDSALLFALDWRLSASAAINRKAVAFVHDPQQPKTTATEAADIPTEVGASAISESCTPAATVVAAAMPEKSSNSDSKQQQHSQRQLDSKQGLQLQHSMQQAVSLQKRQQVEQCTEKHLEDKGELVKNQLQLVLPLRLGRVWRGWRVGSLQCSVVTAAISMLQQHCLLGFQDVFACAVRRSDWNMAAAAAAWTARCLLHSGSWTEAVNWSTQALHLDAWVSADALSPQRPRRMLIHGLSCSQSPPEGKRQAKHTTSFQFSDMLHREAAAPAMPSVISGRQRQEVQEQLGDSCWFSIQGVPSQQAAADGVGTAVAPPAVDHSQLLLQHLPNEFPYPALPLESALEKTSAAIQQGMPPNRPQCRPVAEFLRFQRSAARDDTKQTAFPENKGVQQQHDCLSPLQDKQYARRGAELSPVVHQRSRTVQEERTATATEETRKQLPSQTTTSGSFEAKKQQGFHLLSSERSSLLSSAEQQQQLQPQQREDQRRLRATLKQHQQQEHLDRHLVPQEKTSQVHSYELHQPQQDRQTQQHLEAGPCPLLNRKRNKLLSDEGKRLEDSQQQLLLTPIAAASRAVSTSCASAAVGFFSKAESCSRSSPSSSSVPLCRLSPSAPTCCYTALPLLPLLTLYSPFYVRGFALLMEGHIEEAATTLRLATFVSLYPSGGEKQRQQQKQQNEQRQAKYQKHSHRQNNYQPEDGVQDQSQQHMRDDMQPQKEGHLHEKAEEKACAGGAGTAHAACGELRAVPPGRKVVSNPLLGKVESRNNSIVNEPIGSSTKFAPSSRASPSTSVCRAISSELSISDDSSGGLTVSATTLNQSSCATRSDTTARRTNSNGDIAAAGFTISSECKNKSDISHSSNADPGDSHASVCCSDGNITRTVAGSASTTTAAKSRRLINPRQPPQQWERTEAELERLRIKRDRFKVPVF